MLVGRDLERREVEQALARARSGASATLALVGEPGIGKTALLGYAAAHAEGRRWACRGGVADPTAVLVAAGGGGPSLLGGADLPVLPIGGLTSDEAAMLVQGLTPEAARRLHGATAGNPLALLELAPDADELALAPVGAPVLVSARSSRAFPRRAAP